ncbi:MAG: ABC transporter permease [Bifidobacteriaceae bacterium]|jgi:ABC-type dipeptide/oligopeptide/nickel transport system permease subunit|nr:ABC transporter permease [Bifidobacteriaceae bacterium]
MPTLKSALRKIPGVKLLGTTHGLQRLMLLIGSGIMALFVLVAIFADSLAPYALAQRKYQGEFFGKQQPPSSDHILGTTVEGYDVLSRVIYGARTALLVVIMAVAASIVIGVALGVISGYLGGWLDRILVLIMDAVYAFPSLLLAIVVAIVISGGSSSGFGGMMAASLSITVVFVPRYFRVVRNATLSAKSLPYVEAAKVGGARPGRIMFGHVLPNVSQSIPVLLTLNASEAILTLASLGFLGFGIEPTSASEWGRDLSTATTSDLTNGIWWTSVYPGLAIVLVVTGVTLIGESLNDVLNPLLRTRGGTTTADERELEETVLGSQADMPDDVPAAVAGHVTEGAEAPEGGAR